MWQKGIRTSSWTERQRGHTGGDSRLVSKQTSWTNWCLSVEQISAYLVRETTQKRCGHISSARPSILKLQEATYNYNHNYNYDQIFRVHLKRIRLRPISTSTNSISANWPRSNWPKSSVLVAVGGRIDLVMNRVVMGGTCAADALSHAWRTFVEVDGSKNVSSCGEVQGLALARRAGTHHRTNACRASAHARPRVGYDRLLSVLLRPVILRPTPTLGKSHFGLFDEGQSLVEKLQQIIVIICLIMMVSIIFHLLLQLFSKMNYNCNYHYNQS